MLQLSVLRLPGRGLRLPTRVRSLRIDPSIHLETVKGGSCDVKVDPRMDMVVAGGVELRGKPLRDFSHTINVFKIGQFHCYVVNACEVQQFILDFDGSIYLFQFL